MSVIRQLPLPFEHVPGFAAVEFFPAASNKEALAWLERTGDWPQGRLALWGPAGCGKTHLLHVWAGLHGAALLSGAALRLTPPDRPVAIDDAETAPERSLLHLLNAAAEAEFPVLLAGRLPPARWPTALPDLTSRLRAITSVEIRPAEEALLRILLARLLAERQLAVPEPVQAWLLLRLPRTPAALREAAFRLDRASLAAGRRITQPLAEQVLAELTHPSDAGANDEDFAQSTERPSTATPSLL